MQGRLVFFGTSASLGIPVIGCECSVCLSDSPLNRRTRPAALLQIDNKNILIDVGPDFHHQAIHHRLTHLDGVILTHTHYDHIAGFDDLRAFYFKAHKPLHCLGSKETLQDLHHSFEYLFKETDHPKFTCQPLSQEMGKTEFLGIPISYVSYRQVGMKVTGYRFGNLAFVTDVKEYSTSLIDFLTGCDTAVLSALDWTPTKAHIGIEEAIGIAKQSKVRQVFLTHIGHELDHELTNQKLPSFMQLAYDGMSISFNC